MVTQTGSTYNLRMYNRYHQNSKGEPGVFDLFQLEESVFTVINTET